MYHSHLRFFLFAVITLTLAGCGPSIVGLAPAWNGAATEKPLEARVIIDSSDYEVVRVVVHYSRHNWPGVVPARSAVAAPDPGNPTLFRHQISDPENFRRTYRVFFQWELQYTDAGGGPGVLRTATSPLQSFRIGCTEAGVSAALARDQALIAPAFRIANPHIQLSASIPPPPHGFVSFIGMGETYVGPLNPVTPDPAVVGLPHLLFYAPLGNEATAGGNLDVLVPAPPYQLIGWAHVATYVPDLPPSVGCLPAESWFVHEAGFHLLNGGFAATPPVEAVLGAGVATAPDNPVANVFWHPRLWDFHVWPVPGGTQPATGILNPSGQPATGQSFLPGDFFFPTLTP